MSDPGSQEKKKRGPKMVETYIDSVPYWRKSKNLFEIYKKVKKEDQTKYKRVALWKAPSGNTSNSVRFQDLEWVNDRYREDHIRKQKEVAGSEEGYQPDSPEDQEAEDLDETAMEALMIDDLAYLRKKGDPIHIYKKIDGEIKLVGQWIPPNADTRRSVRFKEIEWNDEEARKDHERSTDDDSGFQPDSPVDDSSLADDEDDEDDEDDVTHILSENELGLRTVHQNRKAFVNWLNNDFYKKIQTLAEDSPLKVYQVLVQNYLALNTPYRGLLVYHGLGTGKTASAISLAEGLSKEMRITTLIPASLETEFVKEVRKWGHNELNRDGKWVHRPWSSFSKTEMVELSQKYALNGLLITQIMNATKRKLKKMIAIQKEKTSMDEGAIPVLQSIGVRDMTSRISELKGCFLPDPDGRSYDELDYFEKAFLDEQINVLVHRKYNFIHYKPFPKVSQTNLKAFQKDVAEDEDANLLSDKKEGSSLTDNQKLVKTLEKRLKYNQKYHSVNSPFFQEVIVIDEVHNFVRQILNGSHPSRIFYEWIMEAREVKLVFLSGTPFINKPAEIAILYNMLKGKIRTYNFTIETEKSVENVNEILNEQCYSKASPIELCYVETRGGKMVASFTMLEPKFESVMDPSKDNIIYTIKQNDHTFSDFLDAIYSALHKITDKDKIMPAQATLQALSKKRFTQLYRGDPQIYDKDLEVVFNRTQNLFDMMIDGRMIDLTNNEAFMDYFFESLESKHINERRKILLRRMLMGMTSYYPIDRSSIVDMPQIVKPEIVPDGYRDQPIVKDMNIVPCLMSQVQYEKYAEALQREMSMDRGRAMRRSDDGDDSYHYHTRTRQACNIVYRKDEFRTMRQRTKEEVEEAEKIKQQVFDNLRSSESLAMNEDLKNVSPKIFQIMRNMQKFMKDGKPTGKILFYSDFRSDAGSEAFELALRSNGYERFDTKNPQGGKGLRYTFITGSEPTDERRINKEHFNDDKNKYGEYIQIMIISSAGAEGISLTCVRQVHIFEPYWNYVRLDQVLGRAIRMRSHNALPKSERNVEQYLYLSVLPPGTSVDQVFETIKHNPDWQASTGINDTWTNVQDELAKDIHKNLRELFESIIRTNMDSEGLSIDQKLFNVMNQKYTLSQEVTGVIQESAIDCIQHTRDNPQLNDRCVRFLESEGRDLPFALTSNIQNELAYFPGIDAKALETIDHTQVESTALYHQKPDIYVIALKSKSKDEYSDDYPYLFAYYRYQSKDKPDIRYLRENATRLCDLKMSGHGQWIALRYLSKEDPEDASGQVADNLIFGQGREFSITHEIYDASTLMDEDTPPSYKIVTANQRLLGYKLKYNVDDRDFFMKAEAGFERAIHRFQSYRSWNDPSGLSDAKNHRYIYHGSELYLESQ